LATIIKTLIIDSAHRVEHTAFRPPRLELQIHPPTAIYLALIAATPCQKHPYDLIQKANKTLCCAPGHQKC